LVLTGTPASLFPDSPTLTCDRFVDPVHGAPKPPPDRITLTLRTLNSARRVIFLATGADKAIALAQARAVPAGMIAKAEWLVDEAAASQLQTGRRA
jgi:6-phosphogluconolactonase